MRRVCFFDDVKCLLLLFAVACCLSLLLCCYLLLQVQKNQKRAAKVWLDEYYALFYLYHPEARQHAEGDLRGRLELRYNKLNCVSFQWFVDKFRPAFERKLLLDHDFKHIQHAASGAASAAN